MIEDGLHELGPKPLRVPNEHDGDVAPLYSEPLGNRTLKRWTIGWLAAPSVCHLMFTSSFTPCGCLDVPALCELAGGGAGMPREPAASATVAPAAASMPPTPTARSLRMM